MMVCAVVCGISFWKFLGKFASTSTKTLKTPLYIMISVSGRGLFLFHFSSTIHITANPKSHYDWRVVSRKETLKFSREFIGLLPCNYPFSTSQRGVTRRQTLSPLPSNTKTQKVEAKWKRNNPLPLTEIIIYKGVLSVLVEVEAYLHKKNMKYRKQLHTPSFVPFRV